MKTILLALLLFLPQAVFAETRDAEKHFFDTKLGNFQEDLAEANKQGKSGVLLFFEQEDCPWCARMKATILNQSDVQEYFHKNFLIYPVDVNGDVQMTDFKGRELKEKAYALENRVRATPGILFFDSEGNLAYRYTGAAKNRDEFMLLGRYVVEKIYKSMPFEQYKRNQAAAK